MPGKDQLTKKTALFGNNRSHALNSTKRRFDLNLQTITINKNGRKTKMRVSAKTIRTLKKQGKIS